MHDGIHSFVYWMVFLLVQERVTVQLSSKSKRDHPPVPPQTQPGPDSQAANCGVSGTVWDQRWVTDVLLPGTVVTACRKPTFQHWRCNLPKLGPGTLRGSYWFISDQVAASGLRDWAIWKPSPPPPPPPLGAEQERPGEEGRFFNRRGNGPVT